MSVATVQTQVGQRAEARQISVTAVENAVEAVGRHSVRYGLVAVLLWIGAMKFTAYEAEAISGLVANSPLMSWVYQFLSPRQFGFVLGVSELSIAALIAVRPFSPRVSAVGSALAVGMFLTTLSFLLSTPGVVEESIGFPAISVLPGQFLLKDLVLLGAAIWTASEALAAARKKRILDSAEIHGYDPVEYFTSGTPTRGEVDYTSTHEGRRFHFATLENRDRFQRAPQRYLPQYGGYCALGVSMGQLFDVEPKTGQVIDGKLYVNLNNKILEEFNKDKSGHIKKAEENWPKLVDKEAA